MSEKDLTKTEMGEVTESNYKKETVANTDEDFRFMIAQAIKAPSGHNTQPWIFKITDIGIEIHPDLNRSLPIVDPDHRELFVAVGTATENLCLAATAKGYRYKVSYREGGIVVVNLIDSQNVISNLLFDQIAVRQTNRGIYDGTKIAEVVLDQLKNIDIAPNVQLHFYANGTSEFNIISDFVFRGNTAQMQNRAFTEELKAWIRYNKQHQNATNDGLSYATFGAPNLPMFIIKPIMAQQINEKAQNKGDKQKIASSSHFVLFTTKNDSITEWIDLGRTLERFLLTSTSLDIRSAYLNQPNEVRELASEMAHVLNLKGESPVILVRIGYGKQMPYSKRRDLESFILRD